MEQYHHLTKSERHEVAILRRKGYSIRAIANELKRSVSTISDEIRRNSVKRTYDAEKANHKAYVRRKYSKYQGMKIVEHPNLRNYVETKLKEEWSPQCIAGRIREIETQLPRVSHEGIYKYVHTPYGYHLQQYLPSYGKKRKTESHTKKALLENRTFIDDRPKIVERRGRFGDWEGDLIVSGRSGRGVLLVLYERLARYVVIKRLLTTSPDVINAAFAEITGGMIIVQSVTLDNDLAFRKHEQLSELLDAPVYFCHPYHSWEKGGVESVNHLIRRYVPKGSDISQYTDEYITTVAKKLNDRPRRCLGYKTPREAMGEHQQFRTCVKTMVTLRENKKEPMFGLRA